MPKKKRPLKGFKEELLDVMKSKPKKKGKVKLGKPKRKKK